MKHLSQPIETLYDEFLPYVSSAEINAIRIKAVVAAVILKKRISLGMNQKEFASYMGVSQGMISKWESGNYNFTIDSLCEISEKIDLDFDISLEKNKQIIDFPSKQEQWAYQEDAACVFICDLKVV